jgi:hypothetical protein
MQNLTSFQSPHLDNVMNLTVWTSVAYTRSLHQSWIRLPPLSRTPRREIELLFGVVARIIPIDYSLLLVLYITFAHTRYMTQEFI